MLLSISLRHTSGGVSKKLESVARALSSGRSTDGGTDIARHLESLGAPAGLVAQATRQADQGDHAITVLSCNWEAVQTFRRCQMAIVQGLDRPRALGFAANEIGVVLMLRRVHQSHWPTLLDEVLYMGSVAAEIINSRLQ